MSIKKDKKKKERSVRIDRSTINPSKLGFFGKRSWHFSIIFCLAFILYGNTLTHSYTQDDAIVIYDNMFTTDGISGIPGLLSKDTFFGFFKEDKSDLVSGGRYRPLTPIMFAIGWEIFGNNPFVGHLWNIIWYGLLGIVLYLLLDAMLVKSKPNTTNRMIVLLATLLYMAHPIHTEVVANIKGRDEIMTLLCSLFAMYLCFRPLVKNKILNAIIASIIFFLALMSKENAISFLAIIPLGLYLYGDKSISVINKKMIPFLIATGLFLIIRFSVLGMDFGSQSRELMNNPFLKFENGHFIDFAISEKIATIIFTLGKYIQLLIAPLSLTHDYYPRQIPIMNFSNWQVWLSLFTYGIMIFFAYLRFGKKSVPSFSILFFLLSLFIVSNIVFPIGTNMSERFMFMPSVGFCLLLSIMSIKYIYKKIGKPVFVIFIVGIFSLYSFKTISRNTAWKNDYTLFLTDVNSSAHSAKVRNAAGGSLLTAWENDKSENKDIKMVDQAIAHLIEAIKIHPHYRNAHLLLGNAYFHKKEYQKAIIQYNNVLELYPSNNDATRNLAVTYRDYGRYYGEQKNDLFSSLKYLNKAYELNSSDTETMRLLGVCHGINNNPTKALFYFHKVIELLPNNAVAIANVSRGYRNLNDMEKALYYEKMAKDIDPNAFKK